MVRYGDNEIYSLVQLFFLSLDSPSLFEHNETETIEPCTRTNDIMQFENCTIILGDDEA